MEEIKSILESIMILILLPLLYLLSISSILILLSDILLLVQRVSEDVKPLLRLKLELPQ